MKIAFYAPMKSPDHPRPSGDRLIARLLIKALQACGHQVELMSDLRSWEGKGDQQVQQNIRKQAAGISEKIINDIGHRDIIDRPELWFSYHPYHKSPDWIGPRVATHFGIPYVIAEAIYAIDHKYSTWRQGLQQMIPTLDHAAAILCMNPLDIPALERLPQSKHKLHSLRPFLDIKTADLQGSTTDRASLSNKYNLDPSLPWIISVAMMRDDAKLISYRHLAKSMAQIEQPYQLLLIGDGQARKKVEALFSGELASHTRYAGQLDQNDTLQAMLTSDLFVWPAYKEAIGMAILEAQACGLPVVAGDSGAIPQIIKQGQTGYLCLPDDHAAMTKRIDQLLSDHALRRQFSDAATMNFQQHHSLKAAAQTIDAVLQPLF